MDYLVNHIGSRLGASKKWSLEKVVLTVIGVTPLASFKSKSDFEALDFLNQEGWKIIKKTYNMKKTKVVENLSQGGIDLWRQCAQALKNHLKTHVGF